MLQRLAVEKHQTPLPSEAGGELIHYPAVDSAVVVLRRLADAGELEPVETVAHELVERKRETAFQSGRRRKTCPEGYIACKCGIETFNPSSPLEGFAAYAENISRPSLPRHVLFAEAELGGFAVVKGPDPDPVRPVQSYPRGDTLVYGSRKDISSVIVGMFTYQVDASRSGIEGSSPTVVFREFRIDSLNHVHNHAVF